MKITTADAIKISAVVTATPRWVAALLASEGFAIPAAWLPWWVPVSATASAAMAVTEGFAFALIFSAWRAEKDPTRARNIVALAAVAFATFVATLAPQLFASVRGVQLTNALAADWALWLWSACVAASTVMIVASVGYAQHDATEKPIKRIIATDDVSTLRTTLSTTQTEHAIIQRKPRIATPDKRTRAQQLKGEGLTQRRIAEQLGVNVSTVGRWLK